MEKYLIVFELDKILLKNDKSISKYSKKILQKCKKLGNKIVINTVKTYEEAKYIAKEIEADYISCFNGNLILDSKNENIIFQNLILNEEKDNLDNINKCKKNMKKLLEDKKSKFKAIDFIKKYLDKEYKVIAFGCNENDLETLLNVDIGVKMKNADNEISNNIKFSTESNDEDGVAKFLSHYFDLEEEHANFNNVKILDCSLRDGGHLNKSNFGNETIKEFIKKLALANTDIIEMGYLQDCDFDKEKSIYPTVSEAEKLLKDIDCKNSIISLLIQVDKFDISKLEKCTGKVKMIRVSFHNHLMEQGMKYCEEVVKKGYLCSVNLVNFSQYNKEEVVNIISRVNNIKPYVFSIVDTFGVFLNNNFKKTLNLVNHLLDKDIKIGAHLHENLNLAFASAQILIDTNSIDGEVIIDSSISGMGRTPGNLKTEFMQYYINKSMNSKRYNMKYIYSIMENEMVKLKQTLNWDNDFAYGISAFEYVHRTYAEYLKKKGLSLYEIEKLIKLIPKENVRRFNEKVIEEIYNENIK